MLDSINRKREIYDKRPEDHPDYPEEWKKFWEKRYRELMVQGMDPDRHDYKAEWIPHWGRKVAEIFRMELDAKTSQLLRRYNLRDGSEPRREDFADGVTNPVFDKDSSFRRSRGRSPSPRRSGSRRRNSRSRSPPRRMRSPGGSLEMMHRGRREGSADSLNSEEEAELRGPVRVIPVLRRLGSLDDVLGSLGPQVNALIGRALALEECRAGTSNILLEDADVACYMDMVKEKLNGQVMARFLEGSQLHSVHVALRHLNRLLLASTRKRPLVPPKLAVQTNPAEESRKAFKKMVAEQLSDILVNNGGMHISDFDLRMLVYKVIQGTELDDGNLQEPTMDPPPLPPQTQNTSSLSHMMPALAAFGFTVGNTSLLTIGLYYVVRTSRFRM